MSKALCRAVPWITVLLISAVRAEPTPSATLSDAELLEYASRSYSKSELMNTRAVLGVNRGVRVVADFPCSDICPDYTVRVIHYDLQPHQSCSDVGGVEKELRVPKGIAMHDERFCFPKVLAENWDRYER